MTDERGLFEHCRFDVPRPEHGYCLDDAARALIVLMREPSDTPVTRRLIEVCFRLVDRAVVGDGRVHNRMSPTGEWTDDAGLGDWWGRALWALGFVAAHGRETTLRDRALAAFRRAGSARSVHVRALAFAALGAAEVCLVQPDDPNARAILRDAAAVLAVDGPSAPWQWPEPRLRYANASLAEALLAAGTTLDDERLLDRGLAMLRFLLDIETRDGHLSVTGVEGRGPGERDVQFDQQPIEVAAIADACSRAYDLTADPIWRDHVGVAWAWFEGDNDSGARLFDADTGAGYDGLTAGGRNENRGAESTLAALGTYQQARRTGVLDRVSP
ncbi:glycosyltransferase [Microbacterium deminutum]